MPLIESAAAAEWIITPSVTLRQSFTDNARHAPKGDEEADTFTSLTPAISISGYGDRLNLNLDYAVTGRHYFSNDDLDDISHSLLGSGTVEIIDELFFLDARAAIFQALLDPTGSQSAGVTQAPGQAPLSENDSNTTTIKTYSLSPYLRNRFGSFADSELRYSFNQTDSDAGATMTNSVSAALNSGPDFTRLRWVAQAIASDTEADNDGTDPTAVAFAGGPARDSSRQLATLTPEYALNRLLSLLGSVGYERIEDETLRDEPNGIIGNAGVRVNPGPRSTFRVLWNHRYNSNYFTGDGSYLIGPTSRIDFAYTRDIQSGSEYADRLSYLGTDEYGNFIDLRTAQMYRFDSQSVGFTNAAYLEERYSLRFTTQLDRDSISAELYRTIRESQNVLATQTTNGVDLLWQRPLAPLLSFNFGLSFADTEYEEIAAGNDPRQDQTVRGGPGLSYSLSETVSGTLNYDFIYRFSNAANGDQRENIVTVGLRKIF